MKMQRASSLWPIGVAAALMLCSCVSRPSENQKQQAVLASPPKDRGNIEQGAVFPVREKIVLKEAR